MHSLIGLVSERDVDSFRKLIFTCVDAGVPLNEIDAGFKWLHHHT